MNGSRNTRIGLVCISAFLMTCSHRAEHALISLLDQVEKDQVSQPWEVVQFENRLNEMARGGHGIRVVGFGNRTSLLQLAPESEIRLPISVRDKRAVLIHVAYRKGEPLHGEVEARLVDGDQVLASQTRVLRERSVEFALNAKRSGVYWISLLHRVPVGTRLPVVSIVTGTTLAGSDRSSTEQLILLERWLARVQHTPPEGLPTSRRLLIPLEGCTRDCILLGEADTLVTQLPRDGAPRSLCFWHTLLQSMSARTPVLQLEVWNSGSWSLTAQWHVGLQPGWSMTEIPTGVIPAGSDSIRFSVAGPAALVALAEPVLMPTRQMHVRKNLLIVDLDTVRADRLGLYGYETRPTSSALDSIVQAKGFGVFLNALSAAPRTEESTARFFTSRYRLGDDGRSYNTSAATLAEILRQEGFYCAAYTGGGQMLVRGLERGFHEYHWSLRFGKVEDSFPQATEWLQDPIAPFFLFVHTYEAHRPYTRTAFCHEIPKGRLKDPAEGADFLPPPLTMRSELTPGESLYVEALYDGGVRKACEATADLFASMDSLGLWENTIVIVLSDHGEEFWDHLNIFGAHGYSLYGELLDVPFFIYSPEYARYREIDEPVSLVDLVPTALDLLNLPVLPQVDGVSVAPLLDSREIKRPIPILAQVTDRHYREAICVYDNDMKYIDVTYDLDRRNPRRVDRFPYPPPGQELYAIHEDVGERHDLTESVPELADAMAETLRLAWSRIIVPTALREGRASNAVSPDLKAQLEALGYVE